MHPQLPGFASHSGHFFMLMISFVEGNVFAFVYWRGISSLELGVEEEEMNRRKVRSTFEVLSLTWCDFGSRGVGGVEDPLPFAALVMALRPLACCRRDIPCNLESGFPSHDVAVATPGGCAVWIIVLLMLLSILLKAACIWMWSLEFISIAVT